MTYPPGHTLIRQLRGRATAADPTPDGELARRFHADGDRDAFELLVRRHAPTVLHICRSVTGDLHSAEDAAQAVFLVLARKARTVAGVRSAGGWLARVAYRAANRARARAAARRVVPLAAAAGQAAPDPSPDEVAAAAERAAAVQQEVGRLPDKYHAPIVLCYFEGLTTAQAAERLGWPAGTVAGRLARGRALLRGRLARRGVALPAAGLAAVLGRPERAAVAAAVGLAVREGAAVAPAVRELANEVIHGMGTTRRMTWAAAAVLGLVGAAVTAGAGDPPAKVGPPPAGDAPNAPAAPRQPFAIYGRVLDETGRTPMEGVRVRVASGYGTLMGGGQATTDKDGRFRVEFGPGVHRPGGKIGLQYACVWATKPGYYAWRYGWPIEYHLTDAPPPAELKNTTQHTVLTPGGEAQVEFRMAPAATLRARLVGPDGRPLAKTRVWLTGKDLPPASNVLDSGETDADGVWVARDVPRHQYRLVVNDPRVQFGELELGSIRFADPVEYTAEATVHAWTAAETNVSLKVTRAAQ